MCGVFSLSARLHYKTAQAELKMVDATFSRVRCVVFCCCLLTEHSVCGGRGRMMRQLQHWAPSWSDLNLALRVVHTTLRHGSAPTKFLGIKSYFLKTPGNTFSSFWYAREKLVLNPFRGILWRWCFYRNILINRQFDSLSPFTLLFSSPRRSLVIKPPARGRGRKKLEI